MTINTTNQAASIDTPEFWALLREREEGAMDDAHAEELEQAIIDHIDAKLAQARVEGVNAANDFRALVSDSDTAEIKEWKARAIAAESRLAEIRRGVEGLTRYTPGLRWGVTGFEGGLSLVSRNEVLALLQPQGQAEISDWREKASAEFDSKEPLKNTESQ